MLLKICLPNVCAVLDDSQDTLFPHLERMEDWVASKVSSPNLCKDNDPGESRLLVLVGVIGDEGDGIAHGIDVEALGDHLTEVKS